MAMKPESIIELQTGQVRRVVAGRRLDKVSGLERLDLSVAEPEPTAHFKLGRSDGAWFQKKTKDASYGNAWQLSARGKGLELELHLPDKYGVVLILEMCRTAYNTQSDQPVIFSINGEEWPLELDPHTRKFYKQSWYLPHFFIH